MKWNIVADSSCDLMKKDVDCEEVGFSTVEFVLSVGKLDYIDDEQLDVLKMLDDMEALPTASSSACPSPGAWVEQFKNAETTIAITISANLSGSYNSAMAAVDIVMSEHPEKRIVVLDSLSTGPEIALCIHHIAEWIKGHQTIETIVEKAEKFLEETKTTFALSSFNNLVKNGRMSKLKGFIAKAFGMWGVGIASVEGKIAIKGKARGTDKVIDMILDDLKQRGFQGGEVAISHCFNEEMADKVRTGVLQLWESAKVTILKTRGLDSFYAERGGLIIAFC
ncbi:MAG: DegV family protein [Clostridiaceae bacterium]|nr:DegV family protein [Clostridiaceae bacterium]